MPPRAAHPESVVEPDAGRPLLGRVALITGASGGGVGSTTARLLAARGAAVIVNYFQNRAGADQVVADIAAGGGRALAVQADVGEQEQVARMVAAALEAYGRLDVLVNNASAGRHFPRGAFVDLTWEQFDEGINARLRPAFLVTQAVVPAMRRQGGGRLIYVGSEHAEGPAAPGMIANGTSGAALVAFVRYLAHELGPDGITANVVSPGGIDTLSTERALAAMGIPPAFRERMAAAVPLGRMATPRDVAGAIAFYAGDDAAFMTGTVAHVNGGFGIARGSTGAGGAAGAAGAAAPPWAGDRSRGAATAPDRGAPAGERGAETR